MPFFELLVKCFPPSLNFPPFSLAIIILNLFAYSSSAAFALIRTVQSNKAPLCFVLIMSFIDKPLKQNYVLSPYFVKNFFI